LSNDAKSVTPLPNVPARTIGATESLAASSKRDRLDELCLLINSRNPIITVETPEEQRFSTLLERVAERLAVPLYTWSVTSGLARAGGATLYNSDQPEQALANIGTVHGDGIFLLKDFARYCDNDRISRKLRDLADGFRTARRSIILASVALSLPPELAADSVEFHLGLPSAEELLNAARGALAEVSSSRGMRNTLDAVVLGQIARSLVGLPEEEALRVLRHCVLARGRIDPGLLEDLRESKRQALRTEGLLESVKLSTFQDVAGLTRLRDWVAKRRSALTPEGQRFGLVPPKGVLITGVQGCGKSLAARAVAGEWGYDLVRMDAGALYEKFVGESEKHLRRTLELAQKLAPVVLWIDEIEKAFASAGSSGDADAGLSQRLLATLLTWMQDREDGVFLAATSNNITVLPPEMLRKGRFDEIFFVDLPSEQVRAALFALHLKKRGRDPATFDVAKLAQASEGYSGAEIEQAIVSGLYTAFNQKQRLTTEILLGEINGTQPLSVTRREEIASIRDWARNRATPAD
jgi:SpoVK/Ycf46/Vps4 family AAA+-type ATPase